MSTGDPRGAALSDRGAAYVRTLWPLAVGHAAAWAARRAGLPLADALAYELVAFVAAAAVYAAGRWLECRRWRPAQLTGRWLLSLGLDIGPPSYDTGVSGSDTGHTSR